MSIPAAIRVGGEVDALCTRCELTLAHTIVAMVGPKVIKVKCNTCGSDHQFRGQQPLLKQTSFAAPKKGGAAARTPKADKVAVAWEDTFKGKDVSRAKRYSPKETFAIDDVVDHPTFGLGLVLAVRGDKVDIAFKQAEKTLIHSKGAPPVNPPETPPPAEAAAAPKPVS